MKLSQRLQTLADLVPRGVYAHIWDCCCDHGFLASVLIATKRAPNVHFIDIVPELIEKITLRQSMTNSAVNWTAQACDITRLRLSDSNASQLIIIAGVGGELTAQFIDAIVVNNPSKDIDFLLCPVRDVYRTRQALINYEFGLLDEQLVTENKRTYEIIYASRQHAIQALSLIGEQLWQPQNSIQLNYLARLIKHLQNAAQTSEEAKKQLALYQQLIK
ncbi:hypothetical protein PALB_34870 [Pseudoalteromonas luteoviolacea B = ATCC 29581]|nr:hypothetical protein PALB_34870 [Pseudoalteromonas luteoviolacea B = ATCC 29581]